MIIVTQMCLGHVYIYPNPLGHTLRTFASIEYELGILIKDRGRLRKWFGEVSKCFHYITDGSGRVRNPMGDVMEVSEWREVKPMNLWKVRNAPERNKTLGGGAMGHSGPHGPTQPAHHGGAALEILYLGRFGEVESTSDSASPLSRFGGTSLG
jgi:hypothetical protein